MNNKKTGMKKSMDSKKAEKKPVVFVPVDKELPFEDVKTILEESGSSMLIIDRRNFADFVQDYIEYGTLDVQPDDAEDMACYIEDENFADLMDTFLWCMREARKSGGLYCDNVVSKSA